MNIKFMLYSSAILLAVVAAMVLTTGIIVGFMLSFALWLVIKDFITNNPIDAATFITVSAFIFISLLIIFEVAFCVKVDDFIFNNRNYFERKWHE